MASRGGFAALALVLVIPVFSGAASVDSSSNDEPCPGFEIVPGQGPSCPDPEGGWWVLLESGDRMYTHGPDPAPTGEGLPIEVGTESDGPVCALPGTPRAVLLYTVPADKTSRYTTMAPRIRDLARAANTVVAAEAARHGHHIDLRVECNAFGSITVHEVQLATPASEDSFATITNQLQARGYTDPQAKYWAWHDNRLSGLGGQGNRPTNDDPTSLNAATRGPHYALTYGYESVRIMLHELSHTMGAVQNSAPNTSGAGHCVDGWDYMCYNDGGSQSHRYSSSVCSGRQHFDCNNNDYFHPAPPHGNYLHDHWNLASHLNPFMEIRNRCESRAGAVLSSTTPFAPLALREHWVFLEASCAGRYYKFVSPHSPSLSQIGDLDVCWYAGGTLLTCHDAPGPESGTIPNSADRGRITYFGTGVQPFVFNVN